MRAIGQTDCLDCIYLEQHKACIRCSKNMPMFPNKVSCCLTFKPKEKIRKVNFDGMMLIKNCTECFYCKCKHNLYIEDYKFHCDKYNKTINTDELLFYNFPRFCELEEENE